MARYNFMVEMAWGVVDRFRTEWELEPQRWERERDVQVAIASRLDTALRQIGKATVEGQYPPLPLTHFNRVGCEPCIRLNWDTMEYCHPDIVLWADLKSPSDPPDGLARSKRSNWPMLWACEIKYESRPSKKGEADVAKLSRLIESGDLDAGCFIDIIRQGTGKSTWLKTETLGRRLWIVKVFLPPPPLAGHAEEPD